jgi:eukaryotic-like serine/threonine-protein kinase
VENPIMGLSQARTARRPTSESAIETRRTGRPRAQAPVVLNRYRLHQRLGAGAYGTVWMAGDERLERDVAVKIMPRERIVTGRFEREARAAARLSHPAIVTLYEASVDDDGAYLVSELVRGTSLDRLLTAGRLSDLDVVSIGIAVCEALEHAHGQGVVHRDVKPSNVLVPEHPVTPAQCAKLTDFGIALVIGGDALTMTGDVVGTPAYMAPEQAEGLPAGATADLFSLAVVVYEALTGVNPVGAGSAALRARRLGAHLPPLRRQRRDLPPGLGQGIDLALRPRPGERGAISELRGALTAARDQVGDETGVVAAPRRIRRRHRSAAGGEGSAWGEASPGREAASWPQTGSTATSTPGPDPEQDAEPGSELSDSWPARALAALGAAVTAVWLAVHVLGSAPIPPALAGLAAGAMILVSPRGGWLALTGVTVAVALIQGHAGLALMAFLALALPIVVLARSPGSWALAAGAPALSVIGLAGAWPALAARAKTPWRRAGLAGIGWVWLLLAAPVLGRALYLPQLPGVLPASEWGGSVSATVAHVLSPLLSSGAFAPAIVWAAAALILPWIVRGRSPLTDLIAVAIWSAALALCTALVLTAVGAPAAPSAAPTAVVGAVAGAIIALAPSWLSSIRLIWRPSRHPTGPGGQFP